MIIAEVVVGIDAVSVVVPENGTPVVSSSNNECNRYIYCVSDKENVRVGMSMPVSFTMTVIGS